MAIDRTAYLSWTETELATERDKIQAEIDRQRTAGGSFGLPGGRSRSGVPYQVLLDELLAIKWALAYIVGDVVTDTIGDCGREPV